MYLNLGVMFKTFLIISSVVHSEFQFEILKQVGILIELNSFLNSKNIMTPLGLFLASIDTGNQIGNNISEEFLEGFVIIVVGMFWARLVQN